MAHIMHKNAVKLDDEDLDLESQSDTTKGAMKLK